MKLAARILFLDAFIICWIIAAAENSTGAAIAAIACSTCAIILFKPEAGKSLQAFEDREKAKPL